MGNRQDVLIGDGTWVVLEDRRDVVTCLREKYRDPKFGILIKQEPHTTCWRGTCWAMNLRLAVWSFFSTSKLAYCKQALTSSTVRLGKSVKSSSRSGLCASLASTNSTGMRVPRTVGLPTRIAG